MAILPVKVSKTLPMIRGSRHRIFTSLAATIWFTFSAVAQNYQPNNNSTAGPQNPIQALMTGNSRICLSLADDQVATARSQNDLPALADGLTWRGIALACQGQTHSAEYAWAEGTRTAAKANLPVMQLRLLVLRSLWAHNYDEIAANKLWNQARKLAAGLNDASQMKQAGHIMDIAGIAQGIDWGAACKAFGLSQQLLAQSDETQPEQAVVLHNLAFAQWQSAHSKKATDAALKYFNDANSNLLSAFPIFQAHGESESIGAVCCALLLSWLADSRDDQSSKKSWSDTYQQLSQGLASSQVRDLAGFGMDNYLLLVPGGTNSSEPVVIKAKRNNLRGLQSAFSVKAVSSEYSVNDFITGLNDNRPVLSFLEGWGSEEGWSSGGLPIKSERRQRERQNTMPNNSPSGGFSSLPPGIQAAVQARLSQFNTGGNNTSPAGNTTQTTSQTSGQSSDDIHRSENQYYQNRTASQLPGGSPMTPAVPASGDAAGNSSEDGLEFDHPPALILGVRAQGWVDIRRMSYNQISADQDDRKMAGLAGLMTHGQNYLILDLVNDNENRAAWQVREELNSVVERRNTRMKEFLSTNSQTGLELASEEAKSYQAFYNLVRQFMPTANTPPSDPNGNSWADCQRYEEAVARVESGNLTPLPPLLTPEKAAQALPKGCVYVSFAGDEMSDNGVVFLLKPGADPAHPEFLVKKIAFPTALAFRFEAAAQDEGSSLDDLSQMGRQLFARLFPDEIGREVLASSRVIISPQERFWSFPFGALVINDSDAPKFLGLEKALSYTESIQLLEDTRKNNPAPPVFDPADILAVGGIDFDKLVPGNSLACFGQEKLPQLPDSRTEAANVAAIYHAQPIIGDDASEPNIRPRLENASVIHIASHGYPGLDFESESIADNLPTTAMINTREWTGSPGIWLAAGTADDAASFSRDGLLQAWEVEDQLDLHADLVVLSACETGSAKSSMAYGPELPLAFLHAGAHSVVAAQTKVNDDVAATLMPAFHRLIKQGIPKDAALQQALVQLAGQGKFVHPAFWSPFILVGNPDNGVFQQ